MDYSKVISVMKYISNKLNKDKDDEDTGAQKLSAFAGSQLATVGQDLN